MPRIRSIKPEFFKSEQICELPAMVRLLFIGLWTQADREGKLEDRPKRLKIELFPYENYDIDKALNELQTAGLILRYKVNANGNARILAPEQPNNQAGYILIQTFLKHQQPNIKEGKSIIPDPETLQHGASTVQALQEMEMEMEMEGKGMECERNAIFENSVLDFWGFSEINNLNNFKILNECCRAFFFKGRLPYFQEQFKFYKEWIQLIGMKYRHNFHKYLGKQENYFEDGVWNSENWLQKIAERTIRTPQETISDRGASTASSVFSKVTLIERK